MEKESLGRSIFMDKIFKVRQQLTTYTGIPSNGLFDSLYALLTEKDKGVKILERAGQISSAKQR